MKLLCTHCGSQDHSITSCPKLKISHSAPRSDPTLTPTQQLHHNRLNLVRKYLANPATFPDGLEGPNWKQPHELWYTGHEIYWNELATKRRKPMPTTVTVTKNPVTTVTKNPLTTVTKNPPSQKIISVTQDPPPKKTTPPRGRPRSNTTKSQAERARAYRLRHKPQ